MITEEKEYEQLCEEYRKASQAFWQAPSIICAIVSGLVITCYTELIPSKNAWLKVFLLFISTFMLFVAVLITYRHRVLIRHYIEMLNKYDRIPRDSDKLMYSSSPSLFKWLFTRNPQKTFLILLIDMFVALLSFSLYEFLSLLEFLPHSFSFHSFVVQHGRLVLRVTVIGIAVTVIGANLWLRKYLP